jgi:hypothetical protein
MDEIFFIVEEAPEGGYTARSLGQSIYSEGDSLEALYEEIKDAVSCHFDSGKPGVIHLHIVRDEVLTYA